MENLPEISSASLKQGTWLVYSSKDCTIHIWASSISGKQKVYVDDKLVIEKRKFNPNNEYKVTDKVGIEYLITSKLENLKDGKVLTTISKNGINVKSFIIRVERANNFKPKIFLPVIGVAGTGGLLKAIFELPDLFLFISVGSALIVFYLLKKPHKIILEEFTP